MQRLSHNFLGFLIYFAISTQTMQPTGLWYNFLGSGLLGSISSRLMLQGITCEMTFSEQVSIFNPQHKFKVVILFNNSDRVTFLTEQKKHLYREWVSSNSHPKITIVNSRPTSIVISQYGIVYCEMNCFRLTISLLMFMSQLVSWRRCTRRQNLSKCW